MIIVLGAVRFPFLEAVKNQLESTKMYTFIVEPILPFDLFPRFSAETTQSSCTSYQYQVYLNMGGPVIS